jgi:antitoxin ParD1/3/4
MAKNTSITLGDHLASFVSEQVSTGRYGNASEVVRASLRLLEEHEQRVEALRRALVEGESSGDAGPLNFAAIRRSAKQQVGLDPERD